MFSRRSLLQLGGLALMGCQREPLLRVATNSWPGYELLHGASRTGILDRTQVRVVRMPSATAVMQALVTGHAEVGALTLDEVLRAQASGLALTVIAVLDVSMGGDMVLGRSQDVVGKTIGVEKSAVGAVMLEAFLESRGLHLSDVQLRYLSGDELVEQYQEGKLDIVVTFSPMADQIQGMGGILLFDSSKIPGMIVDVLAVRQDAIPSAPQTLKTLVHAQFEALAGYQQGQPELLRELGLGLGIHPDQLPKSFAGLAIPDATENHRWLQPGTGTLYQTAERLQALMMKNGLLSRAVSLSTLGDHQFLPPAGP